METLQSLIEKAQKQPGAFPNSVDYETKYKSIDQYLIQEVHPHVQAGSVMHDTDIGYLTDHGPEHIKTVMARALELIAHNGSTPILTPYEIFILAVAIHFHDVGNIYGRAGHEHELDRVLIEVKKTAHLETSEWRIIRDIARAHGGQTQNGDKDTIRELPQIDHILGQRIRPRMIASILRFADELAEEKKRAARFLDAQNLIPESSKIFHAYAQAIESIVVDVNGGSIIMKFDIAEEDVIKTFGKGDKQELLMKEIYDRTLKTHLECVYCMRFLRPDIDISHIKVSIKITSNKGMDVSHKISYELEEGGYPSKPKDGIYSLCPDLQKDSPENIKQKFEITEKEEGLRA